MSLLSDGIRPLWRLQELIALKSPSAMERVPLVVIREAREGSSPWPFPIKHLDFHSLYVAERGRGLHVIDSTTYSTARGDVYVMGAGSEHIFVDCDKLLLHAIHFSRDIFDASTWDALGAVPGFDILVVDRPASRRVHLDPVAYAEVARDLAELSSEWQNGTLPDALLVRTLFLRVLLRLARLAAGTRPPQLRPAAIASHHEDIVAAAVRTIELNYAQRLRVEEIAASLYLSRDRFSEIFSTAMGRTPRDYISYVRLERAKTLLTTTAIPVSEVARATGFRHHTNFTRCFRAATGSSAREFRRKAQG